MDPEGLSELRAGLAMWVVAVYYPRKKSRVLDHELKKKGIIKKIMIMSKSIDWSASTKSSFMGRRNKNNFQKNHLYLQVLRLEFCYFHLIWSATKQAHSQHTTWP